MTDELATANQSKLIIIYVFYVKTYKKRTSDDVLFIPFFSIAKNLNHSALEGMCPKSAIKASSPCANVRLTSMIL